MMGMYFISSVLLLQMSLQEEYRVEITKVLGVTDFRYAFLLHHPLYLVHKTITNSYYHRWFDKIFLSSAILNALVLIMLNQQKKLRTDIYSLQDKMA